MIYIVITHQGANSHNSGIYGLSGALFKISAAEDVEKPNIGFPINQHLYASDLQYFSMDIFFGVMKFNKVVTR